MVMMVLLLMIVALGYRMGVLQAAGTAWFDESFSLHFAQLSWGEMLRQLMWDVHPPGYALVLKLWLGVFGADIFSARMLSVVLGVALVPVIYWLGLEVGSGRVRGGEVGSDDGSGKVGGERVGLIAAGLVAVSPLLAFHAAEGRMYMMLVLLVAVMTLAWWKMGDEKVRSGKVGKWEMMWVASVGFGLLTQVMAVIPVGVLLVAGLWERRGNGVALRRWFGLTFLAALPFVAWLMIAMWHRLSGIGGEWQFAQAKGGWGPGVLADFLVFGTEGFTRMVVTMVVGGLVILGGLSGVWEGKNEEGEKERNEKKELVGDLDRRAVLLVCAVLPIILLAMMPNAAIKYAFVGLPAAAVLVAMGVVELLGRVPVGRYRKLMTAVLLSGYLAVLMAPMMVQLQGPRVRWNKVGEFIQQREQPGDLVYAGWFIMELSLRDYYHGTLPVMSVYPYQTDLTFDERLVRYAGKISYPEKVFTDLEKQIVDHDRIFIVAGGENALASPLLEYFFKNDWRLVERMSADRFTPGVILLERRGD